MVACSWCEKSVSAEDLIQDSPSSGGSFAGVSSRKLFALVCGLVADQDSCRVMWERAVGRSLSAVDVQPEKKEKVHAQR
ncbi:hypothetical protein CV717_28985 [Bacillus cereus]|nr:hypothetical protein CV717_28985 [Bacillus cereus]